MRAVPALLALVAGACSTDGGDGGTRAAFPLTPSSITAAASCANLRTVEAPGQGGSFEAGTMTTVTQAGSWGLLPAGVPLRVSLSGTGDYFVSTFVTTGSSATSTTFSARGIADGTAVRQWTLQAPGSIQLTPAPGSSFTVVVCAA